MLASSAPAKIPLPFANSGTKNTIPTPSQITITPGAASLTDGFPPLTRTPIAAGGVPPFGADMNGILFEISANTQWENAGGFYPYDAAFSTAIGGYPRGAVLARADLSGFWLSQVDNNATNPDTGGAGWVAAFSSGVVGQARNLSMSVAAASATATLTADEIVVETALGGQTYRLASFNKTINLATIGAGGMDTGTAPATGFVALYAIYNPTTATAALLATNAATLQPNVYGGANMPAGYTASALVSVYPTNASRQFVIGFQADRRVSFVPVLAFTVTANSSGLGPANISTCVPLNAKSCSGSVSGTSTTASNFSLSVASVAANINGQSFSGAAVTAGQTVGSPFQDMLLPSPISLYYNFSASSGTPSMALTINAFSF